MTVDKNSKSNPKILENLKQADAPLPKPSSRAKDEESMLAHKQKQFVNELGLLGKPFGGRKEKPGNISGLVIVLCFVIIIIVYLNPPATELGYAFGDIFSALMSIITLILGYLFGSNDRS